MSRLRRERGEHFIKKQRRAGTVERGLRTAQALSRASANSGVRNVAPELRNCADRV